MPNYYGLILAGGRGTRFWPRSRRSHAKQVLSIVGDRSLIQATVDRLAPLIPPKRLWVITNEHLRDEIVQQLPMVPARQILAEPVQRNTAPAIGLAAHILHSLDPDAVMGVFPSDHVIARPHRYRQLARAAFRAAEKGKLGVLGIEPQWAETGYGYIEFPRRTKKGSLEPARVVSFREKPDAKTAARYVSAGRFFWNAGMFFWRADVLLEALRRHVPKTATILASLPRFSSRQFQQKLRDVFPRCENISIDYAVLERAPNVVGLACDDIGWNDVGSWNAVYELLARDRDGNVSRSDLVAADSCGNYIDAGKKLVALLGAQNLIVVDTADALLVADRNRAQQVADIVKLLEQNRRLDLL
ncbi:MAG TPA: mannose-1-phosphate guanylyltransferase [Bryobacteraceae bacterium]|nr:mannose-1-phosphate guanylyltransferase [Bryobacteraceae bacterium]